MSEVESGDNISVESTTHPEVNTVKPEPVIEAKVEQSPEKDTVDSVVDDQEGSENAPKKKQGGFKRKIERLQDELAAKEAELANYRSLSQQKQDNASDGAPKIENFENVLDYVEAITEWKSDQKIKTFEQKQSEAAEAQQIEKSLSAYEERAEKFKQETPDFEEKEIALANSGLVNDSIRKAIISSDMSEKVVYHLANNPGDLMIMQSLDNAGMKRAISMIEDYIEGSQSTKVTAARQTKAAAPITPVKAKATITNKDFADMSQQEIERWRYGDRR